MSANNQGKRAKMSALAEGRRAAYAFLGTAFCRPPSAESLSAVGDQAFRGPAGELFGEQTLGPLRQYARAAGRAAEPADQARQEFMNLFKVPGGQYVTPYESVFRDTREVAGRQVKGLLMGQSAVDVQKWYKLAALDISDEYKDLPDHVGLELSYLAHLCGKEQEFASAGDQTRLTRTWEMQRDFLAAHVVPWIGSLRDKVHRNSQHAYFRAVADMAVEFARRDLATLEDLVGPSSGKPVPQYDEIGS